MVNDGRKKREEGANLGSSDTGGEHGGISGGGWMERSEGEVFFFFFFFFFFFSFLVFRPITFEGLEQNNKNTWGALNRELSGDLGTEWNVVGVRAGLQKGTTWIAVEKRARSKTTKKKKKKKMKKTMKKTHPPSFFLKF